MQTVVRTVSLTHARQLPSMGRVLWFPKVLFAIAAVMTVTTLLLHVWLGGHSPTVVFTAAGHGSVSALISHKTDMPHTFDVVRSAGGRKESVTRDLLRRLRELEHSRLSEYSKVAKTVLFHGSLSVMERDIAVYRQAFTRWHFDVVMPSELDGELDELIGRQSLDFKDNQPSNASNWVALICLAFTDGEQCIQPSLYRHLKPYQRVSRIPGLRNTLWKQDALCTIMYQAWHMNAFRHSPVSPLCWTLPSQLDQLIGFAKGVDVQQQWLMRSTSHGHGREIRVLKYDDVLALQNSDIKTRAVVQQYVPKLLHVQKSLIRVKVFVLVTSASPLRVHMHEEGSVYFMRPETYGFSKVVDHTWRLSQLGQHLRTTYGAETEKRAFCSIKQAVVSTLLIAEPWLRKAFHQLFQTDNDQTLYQCQHCFQLLSMELLLNESFHAVVLEVNGQPSFAEQSDDGHNEGSKQCVADDAVNLLFGMQLVARDVAKALDLMSSFNIKGRNCSSEPSTCLTDYELLYLLDSKKEKQFSGHFQQLYPTADGVLYDNLIADLKSKQTLDGEDNPWFPQTQSTVELHSFLTNLEKIYEHVSLSRRKSHPNSVGHGVSHKSEKNHYEKALISNILGDDSYEQTNGCSHDAGVLSFLRSLVVSEGHLDPPFHPSKTTYHVHVGHEITRIAVEAVAAHCQCQARFDSKRGQTRSVKWVLSVGENFITIFVVDISHTEVWVRQPYFVYIKRAELSSNEEPFKPFRDYQMCSLKQECDMAVFPGEPCGLQRMSESWVELNKRIESLPSCSSSAAGQWVLPCSSCTNRSSCYWHKSTWLPYDCVHRRLPRIQLRRCWARRNVLVIGDSTTRGIMYYMLEQLNGTLTHWSKSHTKISYMNVADHTSFTFAYYPQFWLPENQKPVFERVLFTELRKHLPLVNSHRTVLIIGGVQWLTEHHVNTTRHVLTRMGLTKVTVIIKGYGAGFTQPADGIRYNDPIAQQHFLIREQNARLSAKQAGFYFVDTFNMTISRYKHFLYGRCACHYHLVTVKNDIGIMENMNMEDEIKPAEKYTVNGEINAFYSEIMLNTACHEKFEI